MDLLTSTSNGDCQSSNSSASWNSEVESIIQQLWGNRAKTDVLKSIWTKGNGDVIGCMQNGQEHSTNGFDSNRSLFTLETFSPHTNFQLASANATSTGHVRLDSQNCTSDNNPGLKSEDSSPYRTCHLDAEVCTALNNFHLDSKDCSSLNSTPVNNSFPNLTNCPPGNSFRLDSEKHTSYNSNNFRPDSVNATPCNNYRANSAGCISNGNFPVNSENYPSYSNTTNILVVNRLENKLAFENPSPVVYTQQMMHLNPVAPEFLGDIVHLVHCYTALESHDLDIKSCEKLMGIASLNHPVVLPQTYELQEVEKLLNYSEKQLEFFIKCMVLVEERFKYEEKRLESFNKNLCMWNELRGDRWDAGSFEEAVFSSAKGIENAWSKTNKMIGVLLNENGGHQVTNLRLFPAYFNDLQGVVFNARTAVWAIMEKIRMTRRIPGPDIDWSKYEEVLPLSPQANCTKIPSGSKNGGSTSKNQSDADWRTYKGRRRGKNFKKF